MVSRRDVLKSIGIGSGAFLAAGTSYKQSDAGLLLPKEDLITPIPSNVTHMASGYIKEMEASSHFDHGMLEVSLSMDVLTENFISFAPLHYNNELIQVLFISGEV